jgi:hypothetical protein
MISPDYLVNIHSVAHKLVEAKKQEQREINELIKLLNQLAESYEAMAKELIREMETNNENA